MTSKQCFEQECQHEAQYLCQCSSSETHLCELHLAEHFKLPNRNHSGDSIFLEPYEGTKDAILDLLTKEKLKKEKIKRKVLDSFSQNSKNSLEESLKKIDLDLAKIESLMEKISQTEKISKFEEDPVLKALTLQPEAAIMNIKEMIPVSLELYSSMKLFYGLNDEIERMVESFVKDKFETILDQRLCKIESRLEEQDKIINYNQQEIYRSISDLIAENDSNRRKFEDWKQKIKFEAQNQFNSLNSQIKSSLEDINKKINEVKQIQNQFTQSISNKLLIDQDWRTKVKAILSQKNDLEVERKFRASCSWYENQCGACDQPLSQNYKEYINAYHQIASLYLVTNENNRTKLLVYDTESEREEVKILDTPQPLSLNTCITQLPIGELFCFGNCPESGITLIIDRNYEVRILPSGAPCRFSSSIYFSQNVYCFGGRWDNYDGYLTLSRKFDLDKNRWIELTPMPQADSFCHSVFWFLGIKIEIFCFIQLILILFLQFLMSLHLIIGRFW